MAIAEIHLNQQPALLKMTSITVVLPDGDAGPGHYPVLYLLHGLSDNHTAWTRRTSLERYLAGWPLIVVMPDGGRGWYSDSRMEPAAAVETFVMHDLIGLVDRTFQTRSDRDGRAIAGLSMGGFGAIKLALKHPDRFCAAVSHSGALVRPDERGAVYVGSEMHRIFGDEPAGGPDDIYQLAEKIAAGATTARPALRIDCGTADGLLESNRRFHTHLDELGVAHEYEEHPGGHDWAYWDAHVGETLAFVGRALGIGQK